MTQTENHKYNEPDKGTTNWHIQLNENFRSLDSKVPIKDVASNLSSYEPKDGATFIATDTGQVYDGTGNAWQKATRSYGGVGSDSDAFDNIVFTNQGANDWVVQTADDNSRYGTPTEALQAAASNGGSIFLVDSIDSSEAISSTITITDDFRGPGNRGSANVYVASGADPAFVFEGTGRYEDLYLRGQNNNVDLAKFVDLGRGSVIQNMTFERTDGDGMVMAGCQQMTVNNITFGRVGDPANDTGELRLTNSPNDGLETNAVNINDYHSHGGNNPQGSSILMRADEDAASDRPRNIRVNDVNMENGPSSAVPVFEVCGRDNWFTNVRAMGLDDCSTVFQMQGPRAPSMHIRNVNTVGSDHFVSNEGSTAASSQSGGPIDDVPTVIGCDIDTTAVAFNIPNFNQTDVPLSISDTQFYGTGGAIDVTASKDATPGVLVSNLHCGGQSIDVQGARLSVSNVQDATWGSFSAEFGPRLVSDDGSFAHATFSADTAGGNGVAEVDFSGDFELKDGYVDASVDRNADSGVIVESTSVEDTNADGDLDIARAKVVNTSDGTDAADGVTVDFVVHPRAP